MQWPKKRTKEQTMIDKTLQRKLTIEQALYPLLYLLTVSPNNPIPDPISIYSITN
jgi:hypothetical protein